MPLLLAGSLLASGTPPALAAHHGEALYQEHCAACHGVNLEGQPNWMQRDAEGFLPAPPHDASGHTWHHSDQQLLRIVRDGLATLAPGYKTKMVPYRDVLSDADITAILDYIKSTWPERERGYQAARTKGDKGQ